jgi:hypothetical protein
LLLTTTVIVFTCGLTIRISGETGVDAILFDGSFPRTMFGEPFVASALGLFTRSFFGGEGFYDALLFEDGESVAEACSVGLFGGCSELYVRS